MVYCCWQATPFCLLYTGGDIAIALKICDFFILSLVVSSSLLVKYSLCLTGELLKKGENMFSMFTRENAAPSFQGQSDCSLKNVSEDQVWVAVVNREHEVWQLPDPDM